MRGKYNIDRRAYSPSAELTHKTTTRVPADQRIRPLRDQIIVEPRERKFSAILEVIDESRPVWGIVRAVGPGCYPKRYNSDEKHKRSKVWDSKAFRPTQVRVGDAVYVGNYAYDSFYWGDALCLWCREEDVCWVGDPAELDARAVA